MASRPIAEQDIADLVRRAEEANTALLRGDFDGYLARIPHAPDYTLFAPFGGPAAGFEDTPERRAATARFFRGGAGSLEVVQTCASGDLVVLVLVERQRAAVGELPEQDWSLRVTAVFRREGSDWRLLHRHADPLVHPHTLEQTAALARG